MDRQHTTLSDRIQRNSTQIDAASDATMMLSSRASCDFRSADMRPTRAVRDATAEYSAVQRRTRARVVVTTRLCLSEPVAQSSPFLCLWLSGSTCRHSSARSTSPPQFRLTHRRQR